jgi:hypothetical protein
MKGVVMMSWTPVSRFVLIAGLCSLASGCCTSMIRAAKIDDELRQQNLARAESAMRSAAQRQGATLLPDQPRELGFKPLCDTTEDTGLRTERSCVLNSEGRISTIAGLGNVYQLIDGEGKRHIAITIGRERRWARLAKRGDTLFLLTPRITFRQVAHRAQCECNGGPTVISMSGSVNLGFAFVLEDLPKPEIQPVIVPVVDDYIAWQCKVIYVRNDHVPHLAVAYADARPHPQSFLCAP